MKVPAKPSAASLRRRLRRRSPRRWRPICLEVLEPRQLLAADITTGLVHYWTFDETSGDIAHDSGSSAADGTLQNWTAAEPKWEAGRIGGALQFDTADNAVVVTPPAMTGNYAVSFWANAKDQSGTNARVLTARTGNVIFINNENNRGVGYNILNDVRTVAPNPPTFNTWEHWAINFNATTGQGVIFRSGAPVAIGNWVDSASMTTWVIGHSADLTNQENSLHGALDDLRVYNRLLTDEDIALLASQGTPEPTHVEPVHHWTFDETTGFTAHDIAGGADGTLLNWSAAEPRWEAGRVGGALQFSTSDDAVVTPAVSTHAQWSVTFWLNVSAKTGLNPRIVDPWAQINLENNRGVGFTFHSTDTYDASPVLLNTWEHYAITFDTILDIGSIYRNGKLVKTGAWEDNSPALTLIFGHNRDLSNPLGSLSGLLDDLRIYDRVISTDEVKALVDSPSALPDNYTTGEDKALTVTAPGVLANDSDVLQKPITAVLDSPPTHGTVTLAANGSFTYVPSADYNGPDSFTYHATDGTLNSGSTAVSLNVTPVNDAPSFLVGGDQFVDDESGARQITHWAADVTAGPADEASQTLTFVCAADKPSLLSVQPQVDFVLGSWGRLTYTVAPNVSGVVTVTIALKDSGGMANGGNDKSPPQTFQINIAKPYPWHNTHSALDADHNAKVEPLDALVVINYLNAGLPTDVSSSAVIGGGPGFLDTSRNNLVEPLDALLVIDALNAGQGGEGEGTSETSSLSAGAGPLLAIRDLAENTSGPSASQADADLIALMAADAVEQAVKRRRA